MSSLAIKLSLLRKKKDVSLQKVADAVGVSKPHIHELETGKAANPTLSLISSLACYYNVSIDFLAGLKEVEAKHELEQAAIEIRKSLRKYDVSLAIEDGEIHIVKKNENGELLYLEIADCSL